MSMQEQCTAVPKDSSPIRGPSKGVKSFFFFAVGGASSSSHKDRESSTTGSEVATIGTSDKYSKKPIV